MPLYNLDGSTCANISDWALVKNIQLQENTLLLSQGSSYNVSHHWHCVFKCARLVFLRCMQFLESWTKQINPVPINANQCAIGILINSRIMTLHSPALISIYPTWWSMNLIGIRNWIGFDWHRALKQGALIMWGYGSHRGSPFPTGIKFDSCEKRTDILCDQLKIWDCKVN